MKKKNIVRSKFLLKFLRRLDTTLPSSSKMMTKKRLRLYYARSICGEARATTKKTSAEKTWLTYRRTRQDSLHKKYCSTRPWWVFFLCRSSPSFVVRSPSDGKKSVDRFSDWKISEDLKTERLTRTKDVVVLHLRFSSVSSATANTTADISQDRPSRSGPQKRASCGRLRLFSYGQLMRSFAHQSQNIGRYNYH